MKRTILLLLAILLWGGTSLLHAQAEAPFLPSAADARCKQWVDSVFFGLNLQEKVGQLIVTTFPAKADKQKKKQIRDLVKKYKIGGLLFAEGTPEEQAILTNIAQKNSKVPVMITFDGEWGLSMRLEGTPYFPKNAALGCIEDNQLIYEYGREVAREFRELGVHVNFAPDADVNTNPLNPVIYVRSFGEDPKKVAEKVLAYSRGLESGGVLSVSKHFPGHGDTDVDSHKGLPVLYYNRERLDSVELYPFREMVRAGLGGVMVGHLQVPALEPDAKTASSLSRNVVTGLLKDEMGFQGLVFTDALDMKGVSSVPQLTTKALLAGNDMVLVQYNTANAVQEVLSAVKEGVLSEKEVEAKCRKILTYKYLLGLRQPRPQLQVSGMSYRIHTDEAKALVTRLRQASITVLGNHFGILPLTPVGGAPIALLSIGEGKDSVFVDEMKKLSPVPMECFRLTREMSEDGRRELVRKLADYRRIVVSVSGKDADVVAYADFLAGLDLSVPLVYAFFTSYRGMQPLEPALNQASAVVLGHSSEADIQQYVAGVIFAKVPAQGKLSMSIGSLYQAGEGSVITPGMKPGSIIPEDLGMKSNELHRIDAIVRAGLAAGAYPGCQVLVLKDGQTVYDKCFGIHSDKDTTAVRPTDLFDLASLTKTTATLLAVMKLYDGGKLKLTDKVSQYLPFLRSTNKKNITIKDLLLHESGLPPYIRFYLEAIDPNSVHGPYAQSWVDEWHRTRVSEHSYYCSDFKFKKGLVSEKESSVYNLHVADKMWLNKSFKNTILQNLLYAASPLYNGNTMYKDVKNLDGTQLFPQTYDKELWKRAADAADAAINCCLGAGIQMSLSGENSINKYEKMFYSNTSNPEFILASIQTYGIYEDVSCNSHSEDKGGWGRFSIMQNQVDAYETADGHLPFLMDDDGCIIYDSNGQPTVNPESNYSESGFTHVDELWDGTSWQPCTNVYKDLNGAVVNDMGKYDLYNMYVNRDPRFYASLTFQGAKFRNATEGLERCYHFAYWRNLEYYTYWWVDGYPNVNTNNETGYGLRKFMNPVADIKNWIGTSSNYPLFRLAELYLIKAEALNEYYESPNQDVYDAINEVRSRVEMPDLPIVSEDNTKIGMRKRIRNERRVELFFEGHRFWDVRRWKIGDKCFGIPNYRMNAQPTEAEIMAKANELGYTSMTDNANNPDYWWDRVWNSRDVGLQIYYKRTVDVNCVFSDKMYLFPIPQGDINKNLNLVQNYGW